MIIPKTNILLGRQKGNTTRQINDVVGIADALGDQLYILCGTLLKHGMQNVIEEVFDEIQSSNMSKFDENGKAILREDGKLLKGPNYFKPNLERVIKDFLIKEEIRKTWTDGVGY